MKEIDWQSLSVPERGRILSRPAQTEGAGADGHEKLADTVGAILENVRKNGDAAIREYALAFDGTAPETLAVSPAEVQAAIAEVPEDVKAAIKAAHANITAFHARQGYQPYAQEIAAGITCRRIVRAIDTIGLYIPAGTAPLFSTVLMIGVPSRLAGCPRRILCSPGGRTGRIDPCILYAADLCGIAEIYRIGGAQAIAAMGYGTETVPKVMKIFGPGNAYVTEAKAQVARSAGGAALDMPAGPSEVLVIADDTTNPAFAAADLLSQAEHDTMSQVVLVSTSKGMRAAIARETERQLAALPRRQIAAAALSKSLSILAGDMEEAIAISNAYAPEHLILCVDGAADLVDRVTNAGSVFCGPWSPEAAGDYASGTNHVLPTYGHAGAYSGLTVEAFQKTITVQELTREGLLTIGQAVETMAEKEGLFAHRNAIAIRRGADA